MAAHDEAVADRFKSEVSTKIPDVQFAKRRFVATDDEKNKTIFLLYCRRVQTIFETRLAQIVYDELEKIENANDAEPSLKRAVDAPKDDAPRKVYFKRRLRSNRTDALPTQAPNVEKVDSDSDSDFDFYSDSDDDFPFGSSCDFADEKNEENFCDFTSLEDEAEADAQIDLKYKTDFNSLHDARLWSDERRCFLETFVKLLRECLTEEEIALLIKHYVEKKTFETIAQESDEGFGGGEYRRRRKEYFNLLATHPKMRRFIEKYRLRFPIKIDVDDEKETNEESE